MKWVEALKVWNGKKGGTWCIPRKGSAEYDEVRAIMDRSKPAAVAARNKATSAKALEQLRGVEAATKARNEASAAAAKEKSAAAREAAIKKVYLDALPYDYQREEMKDKSLSEIQAYASKQILRKQVPGDTSQKALSQLKKLDTRTKIEAQREKAKLKTKPKAEVKPVEGVSELPEVVQEKIKEYVGKTTGWNLAKLFMENDGLPMSRAAALIILLASISHGEDGNEKFFLEARADERPTELISRYADANPIAKSILEKWFPGGRFLVEVPTETQEKILTNGFKDIQFDLRRRKGTMGSKSGIVLEWSPKKSDLNLRTKEGKAALKKRYDEAAETAKSYLARIDDKAKDFLEFLQKKAKSEAEAKAKSKSEAKAKSTFVIPATEAKSEFVAPDRFEDVFLAFYGDAGKAKTSADELRAKYPGKRIKFFGRKNLNMKLEKASGSGRMKGGITMTEIRNALDSSATKWISALAAGVPAAIVFGATGGLIPGLTAGVTAGAVAFAAGAMLRSLVRQGRANPQDAAIAARSIREFTENPMRGRPEAPRSTMRDVVAASIPVATVAVPGQPTDEVSIPMGRPVEMSRGRGRRMKGGNWLTESPTGRALMMMAVPITTGLAAGIPVGVLLQGAFNNMGNVRGAEVLLSLGATAVGGILGGVIQEAVRRHLVSRAQAREAQENLEAMEEGAFEMANPMRRAPQNPSVSASPDVTVTVPPETARVVPFGESAEVAPGEHIILETPQGSMRMLVPVEESVGRGGRAMLARLASENPFLAKAFAGMHGGMEREGMEMSVRVVPDYQPVNRRRLNARQIFGDDDDDEETVVDEAEEEDYAQLLKTVLASKIDRPGNPMSSDPAVSRGEHYVKLDTIKTALKAVSKEDRSRYIEMLDNELKKRGIEIRD